jgi:hypothetical protein
MGFEGVAVATTLAGEFTVALLLGLETVIGKPDEGGGGGSWAGGAGRELVVGFHVGGVGVGVGCGAGVGLGVGDGAGAGTGVGTGLGGGLLLAVVAVPPQPASNRPNSEIQPIKTMRRTRLERVHELTRMTPISGNSYEKGYFLKTISLGG